MEKKYLDVKDFEQCDKLVRFIANKQYYLYSIRVSFTKLDREDFYQNGWVALQDCINKGINDLDYVCVAMRNAMYRGVEKTSIIQTTDKRELWHYISGHEVRTENQVSDEVEYGVVINAYDNSLEDTVINRVLTQTILEEMKDDDKMELIRLMLGLPPVRRRVRELSKKRARSILEGEKPYKNERSLLQSEISGVTYDKSKDRWVFSKRVDGKLKKFKTSKDKSEVEAYAREYYKEAVNG